MRSDTAVLDVSMLKDLGCDVVSASSGSETLKMLQEDERILILITDISMRLHHRKPNGQLVQRLQTETGSSCSTPEA